MRYCEKRMFRLVELMDWHGLWESFAVSVYLIPVIAETDTSRTQQSNRKLFRSEVKCK